MTKDGWNKDVLIAENTMLIECQNAQLEELRQENEQLKKEIKELKEQLDEEIDYKLSYYHDLQEEQKRITELEREVLDWKDGSMIVKYEKQLEEKDQKITDLEVKLAEITEKYNACQEARKLEIEFNQQDKAELKQQLAEKDKEIDILTVGLQVANQYSEEIYNKYVKDNKKQLRYKICEKIRNRFDFDINYTFDMNILKDILDEIENGEE